MFIRKLQDIRKNIYSHRTANLAVQFRFQAGLQLQQTSRIVFNVLLEICEDGAFLILFLLQLRQTIFCYVQRIPDGLSKLSRRLLGALKGCR